MIHLSETASATSEVLTALQDDPATKRIPVVVCSDNVTLRQTAVTALRQRPGCVQASSCDPDELSAKLSTAANEADAPHNV